MEEKRFNEAHAIAFSCVACGVRREREIGENADPTTERLRQTR